MSTEHPSDYCGHKTLTDGSRVPLTEDEANALMDQLAAAKSRRASDMPTVRDALSAIIAAEERLRELGWWRGGGLRVRRGDDCAVIQHGSTGMWSGRYQADGQYVLFGDSVCRPRECLMKPLAELTSEERAWMEECDKHEAEATDLLLRRLAGSEPDSTLSTGEG